MFLGMVEAATLNELALYEIMALSVIRLCRVFFMNHNCLRRYSLLVFEFLYCIQDMRGSTRFWSYMKIIAHNVPVCGACWYVRSYVRSNSSHSKP